jgi:predicted permease
LLVRTLQNLRDVDPGFNSANVLTFRLSMHGLYPSDVERSRILLDLTRSLEELPGVEMATFAGDLPLDGDEWRDYVAVEGALPVNESEMITALRVFIGPGYLEAIGAQLLRGRELERLDFEGYPEYVVVNEAFAEQRWPGEDPIGRRLMQEANSPDEDVWYTVSGVVADIRESSLMTPPEPTIYLPTVFKPDDSYSMFVQNMPVVIRTTGNPTAMFQTVERRLRALHPEIPLNSVVSLDELERRSYQQVSFAMALIVAAAGAALILGIIGIYGVVAYLVSLRVREFGVRIALGATPGHVRRTVLKEGGAIALLGIAVGLAGTLVLSRVLASLLFGVAATDASTYGAVSLGLLAIVLLASLGPAQRATAIDPVEAIRAD